MAQVVPQVKVLHDCGDPRLGVFVSDERGEAVAQVELGSASRAQRWVSSARPETITRRKASPRTCAAEASRCASDCATVDFPAAIRPVMTRIAACSSTGPGCWSSATAFSGL